MLQPSRQVIARFVCLALLAVSALDAGAVYDVVFEGVSRRLIDAMQRQSLAYQFRERDQVSARMLESWAEKDEQRLGRLLESLGYFGHQVRHELAADDETDGHRLVYQVSAGPLYTIGSVEVAAGDETTTLAAFAGEVATDAQIAAAVSEALSRSRQSGHPWAAASSVLVHVDRAAARIRVEIIVDEGPRVRVGSIALTGLKRTDPDYVRTKIALREGAWFDQREVDATRRNLSSTDLFNVMQIVPAEEPDASGRVPIGIELRERRFRTVSFTLGYETDLGPGMAAEFIHRNLLGRAERLTSRVERNDLDLRWENRLVKPDWGRPGQDVEFRVDLEREDTDAFESDSGLAEVAVARRLSENLRAGLGVDYRHSRVTQGGESETFRLWSLPAWVERDTSNSLLDADRGSRAWLSVSPYYNMGGGDEFFTKSALRLRKYFRLKREPRVVLAGRLSVGTINALARDDVPANERFYAGGGGSIRGYAHQSVGPLDSRDNPLGGRSLVESSLELRGPLYRNLGLVGFVDAGAAAESATPGDGQDLLVGAGLGLRYATPIGPVRADVAVPLDRRDRIDDRFQFYISIGQAF